METTGLVNGYGREQMALQLNRQLGVLKKKDIKVPDSVEGLHKKLPRYQPSNERVGGKYHALPLVIPFSVASLERQVKAIQLGGGDGGTIFLKDERDVIDLPIEGIQLPDEPYLILDVEDGRLTMGESSQQVYKSLPGIGRYAVTVTQGIALAHHYPETFQHHNIHLSGSRIRGPKGEGVFTPDIYDYAADAKFKKDPSHKADPRWGTPSWSAIITL